MGILTYEFRACANDVGETNKLTNKGFLRLMQEAAISASESVGYGPNTISKTRVFWVLLNWKLEVYSRPSWNGKVVIKTWPRNMIKYYSARDFEIYDENNDLIAIASSKWVLVSLDKGVIKIPEELDKEYDCYDKSVFSEPLDKISEPEDSVCTFEYIVQRRDLDTNHHVNNTIYLDYAYEALPKEVHENLDFKNIEIMYKHEAKQGDNISCFYKKLETGEHVITIKNSEANKLHAIVKLY